MDNSFKKRLNSNTSVNDVNADVFTSVSFNQTQKELPIEEINRVVDEANEFNEERQASKCYRIISTISGNMSNPLIDNTGTISNGDFGYIVFNNSNFTNVDILNGESKTNLTFEESIDRFLIEEDGWFGFRLPDTSTLNNLDPCLFNDMSPTRDELYFLNQSGLQNWDIKLTTPTGSTSPAGGITDGGLLIVDDGITDLGGRTVLILTTPVKHNLEVGSRVSITGFGTGSFDKEYTVIKLGDGVGENVEYTFGIDATDNPPTIGPNPRMRKVVGGKLSEYYYRKFGTIDTNLIGDTYDVPLAKQSFNDNIFQASFDDLDLTDVVDNLGRPASELYVTIVKKSGNGFTDIKSGVEIPYTPSMDDATKYSNIPDVQRINESTTSYKELESNIVSSDNEYFGDVVEYNEFEVMEHILGEVNHTFNRDFRVITVNVGSTILNPRYEGYFYKPHHKIQIRQYSNYIEQGDDSTGGIPPYAVDLKDGRFLWRDLLDIGFNDGQEETLDYPFTNGCHYLHNTICLNLRRQDPFNLYGVYYSQTPEDPKGALYETTDIDINDTDLLNC